MKKLIVVAAAMVLAVAAQAAQFRWQFTASKAAGTPYDGADVYMILASDYAGIESMTLAAIQGAAKSQGKLTVGSMSATTGNITVKDSWVTEGTTYSWYAVVVNDGQYYVSSAATSSTAVGDTATPASSTFASKSEMSTASNWHTLAAVPEPTSGLLLLLGMAGLALKRKRA